ncbi:Phage integrase family protein [Pseudomonas sp. FEN]|nr:Phage integrase family protein [Pseudomonas sp. FEN]
MAAYRDYCLVTCELALNTTRQRLTYICKFYEFALKERWVTRLPFNYEERTVKRVTRFLGHIDASGGKVMANDVMPRSHKSLPKFLSMAEIKSLLAQRRIPITGW